MISIKNEPRGRAAEAGRKTEGSRDSKAIAFIRQEFLAPKPRRRRDLEFPPYERGRLHDFLRKMHDRVHQADDDGAAMFARLAARVCRRTGER